MKAFIEIEHRESKLGYKTKQISRAVHSVYPDLSNQIQPPSQSSWVAEIIGAHPVYKYNRKFLNGHKSYTRANSLGTKGVYTEYILSSGKYYHVKNGNGNSFFCTVDDNGDIIKITENELSQIFRPWR